MKINWHENMFGEWSGHLAGEAEGHRWWIDVNKSERKMYQIKDLFEYTLTKVSKKDKNGYKYAIYEVKANRFKSVAAAKRACSLMFNKLTRKQ